MFTYFDHLIGMDFGGHPRCVQQPKHPRYLITYLYWPSNHDNDDNFLKELDGASKDTLEEVFNASLVWWSSSRSFLWVWPYLQRSQFFSLLLFSLLFSYSNANSSRALFNIIPHWRDPHLQFHTFPLRGLFENLPPNFHSQVKPYGKSCLLASFGSHD